MICPLCKEPRQLEDFSWRNKAKGIRARECKTCHNAFRRRCYNRNRAYEIARSSARKRDLADWIMQLKLSMSCSRCPEKHPATLHFHHCAGDKELNVSAAYSKGWSKARILREIAKCEVLCANCHAKEHHRQLQKERENHEHANGS
jgi:hypothetical protein